LFDQPRGELQRFGADLLALGCRVVEELERRKRRVGQLVEERRLLFLEHALGLADLGRRRLDAQRRMVLLALFLRVHHQFALLARELAQAPVLAPLPGAQRGDPGPLERGADGLGRGEPGDAGEEAQGGGGEREERQRRAGVARQPRADAMRPGRIVAVIGDENEQQVQGERPEEEPFCFAYQAREPGGQRRGAALSHYGQGYSGSMIVSRSTMLEPRISM